MNAKNLFLTGILTIAISCPAFADIGASAQSADCDNGTLGTYEGESNLQAQWNANTINLKWYDDVNGNEITPTNNAAATCTYDDAITLPTNTISKPGYEFAGWRVRTTVAPTPVKPCSEIDNESECNALANCYYFSDYDICYEIDGIKSANCSEYTNAEDCSVAVFSFDNGSCLGGCYWEFWSGACNDMGAKCIDGSND